MIYSMHSAKNNHQPRILYLIKIFFKNEGEIDILRQTKLKFDTNRSSLKKIQRMQKRSEMQEGLKIREPAQLPTL